MRENIKKILSENLDWVKGVNQHENFFEWFRDDGPGRWIGRNISWWLDHVENVNYAMSALHDDILEMYNYSREITDGIQNAEITLETLDLIHEFVRIKHGKSDIEHYINDMTSFIKEFRQYFGEEMSLSDMVDNVRESMEYARDNNVAIHASEEERNRRRQRQYNIQRGIQDGDDLVQLVRGDVNENFDWAINDTVSFLEIGPPLTQSNPKNTYRLHMTHGHGEDAATWADNWYNVSVRDIDHLIRVIKIADKLHGARSFYDAMTDLINMWFEGEKWVLSDRDNENIQKEIRDNEWDLEEDRDTIFDYIREWLDDELTDMGLRSYDSYHQDDATLERIYVTYFDEFGVEHQVKINMPTGGNYYYPWGRQ